MKFLSDLLIKAGLIVEGAAELNAATNTIYAGTGTRLRTEANNLVFERVSSSGVMKLVLAQGTLGPTAKAYLGYSNATLNVILSNEHASGALELRTADVIRQQIFSNGNIVIGQASPVDAGYKFSVTGTAYVSSSLTANSFVKIGGTSSQYLMADGSTSTLTNPVTGTGTTNFLPKFTAASTLGNSILQEGTNAIGLSVTPSAWSGVKVLQSQNSAFGSYTDGSSSSTFIITNGYFDGSVNRYILNRAAIQYIQDTTARGHSWYTAPTGTAGNAITFTQAMTLFNTGNLALNSTTDSGQRLQVTGDTLLKGSGNTSATTALTVQDSGGVGIYSFRNDGQLIGIIRNAQTEASIRFTQVTANNNNFVYVPLIAYENSGATQRGVLSGAYGGTGQAFFRFSHGQQTNGIEITLNRPSFDNNTGNTLNINQGFAPTSGANTWSQLLIGSTINQTGGANGITRGLYVNPNLTAAADWRSIEWSNNTGWGLYGAGTSNNFLLGSLGIGTQVLTGFNLAVGKNITGAIVSAGIRQVGAVQSDVTAAALGIYNQLNIPASTSISSYQHFRAGLQVFGAGATLGTQIGFYIENLTQATNNYGFYGDIASGTGRWNLYMSGTANNYLAGSLGIGSTSLTQYGLRVAKNITGGVNAFGIGVTSTVQSGVSSAFGYYSTIGTAAASFTLDALRHFNVDEGSFGAGSTITYQAAFFASNLSGATTNVGFNGDLSSGTNKWNLYMGGTASNFLSGNTQIGTGAFTSEKLQVNGTMKVTGASTFGGNMALTLNQNAFTELRITNTTSGTTALAQLVLVSNSGGGLAAFAKRSTASNVYKTLTANVAYIYNDTAGDISLLNDHASGQITMAAGGSSTAHFTIASTGAATFSSSVTATSFIRSGGTSSQFLKADGSVDSTTYLSSLTGEATNSGSTVTLTNSAVIGKVLTGLNVTSGAVVSTDSILTALGKVQGQINSLQGGTIYKGSWNASTNTPTITSGTGTSGHYYVVTTAGTTTIDGISSWAVGDWIIFNGTVWEKIPNVDAVISVNGQTGAVSLSTSNITEGSNLYYTDARARAAITLTTTGSSGASTYSSGVLNIPTYTLAGLGGVPTSRSLTINGTALDLSADRSFSVGTVTSIGLAVPTGFTASSAITTSGNITLGFTAGYSLPTTASQSNWDAAYNDRIVSASVSGTTTKTLTLTQQDAGTITASWTDDNSVSSVFGRTGAVVATSGDYTTAQVTESGNLYYTDARARAAISLTTTGSSGASTYSAGVLNVPTYTLVGLGGEPTITAGTTSQYWRGDKSWQTLNTTAVAEGTSLYFTDARARSAVSFTAGSGAYNSSTGVFTIPTNTNQLTNGAGFITGNQTITLSGDVTGSGATAITTTLATITQTTGSSFVKITLDTKGRVIGNTAVASGDITTALGYTPYNSSNPSGYTSNTGTVTTVSVTTANGVSGTVATAGTTPAITLTLGAITPTSVNSVVISGSSTPTLAVTGTSSISGSNTGDNAVNSLYSGLVSNATHTGDATGATALTVVALRNVALPALGASAGFLRYTGTGTNTWVFDTNSYYLASNPSGYTSNTGTVTSVSGTGSVSGLTLTGTVTSSGSLTLGGTLTLTSGNVTTALGFTPYNATNPAGYTSNTGTVTSITAGTYLTGGTITTSGTLAVDATTTNTASKIVARDASGNFSAGTITASLSGNASTASSWQTARTLTIGSTGKSVDGSSNVSWTLGEIGAQAVLTNPITGTGTSGTLPIFTGSTTIGNSIISVSNGILNIDGSGNGSEYALQIGAGRTTSGYAYIDLVGDATYNDYGMRLLRNNSGANSTTVMEHRGTGSLTFKTVDNAHIYFQTGSTDRVFIDSNNGALSIANGSAVFASNTGEQLVVNGSGKFTGGALFATTSGEVLIGTTTDSGNYKLQVNGSVYASAYYESSDITKKNVLAVNPKVSLDVDVVKFTRIGDDDVRYGYSAQQIRDVAPELVNSTGSLGVKYIDVHTLKIAALENEIKELKSRLNG